MRPATGAQALVVHQMNPFTKSIAAHLRSRRLRQFVRQWDALEALVIRVYRNAAAEPADEEAFAALRHWLRQAYPTWQARLEPHWRAAMRGGQPSPDDPFLFLLAPQRAQDFCASWAHLQALPAAREALNRLILEER
jgi:hypothetical protein